ncbi:CHAP domain containing protein [Cellulophaga algicola DSM 14237]|uniref:CHAP domain containing protein n=1 Tax=Cellulophaga algicola (strain DSM 14237 / IC166 / ACAM 630) TaxID=688270 RepID=E6XBY3_CELAD|nr:CHAP domain-containing protein [Cellulophaga algicola]ADV48985.1 CHAP domain containing protein [Cellulophaga algicola DSM 14237]
MVFSAYNWDQFGFKTFDAGSEYIYDIQGLHYSVRTDSVFTKTLWDKLDVKKNKNEGLIDIGELKLAYATLETQEAISKMVCKHTLEWAYTPKQISDEVSKIYDYYISLEDPSVEGELKDLKKQKLQGLEEQIEKMMFWEELKTKVYTPPEPEPEIKERPEQVALELKALGIIDYPYKLTTANDPILKVVAVDPVENDIHAPTPDPVETPTETPIETAVEEQVKAPERLMPDTNHVYHFHPIAFINHMKLMFAKGPTGECFCNKDFTVEDLKKIVYHVRYNTFDKTSKKSMHHHHGDRIFYDGEVPKSDQTYTNFAEVLNTSFNKYGIKTCIQKIHFLANMYIETQYFTKLEEGENKWMDKYKPYIGRGFMHLTHDYHYKEYSEITGNTDIFSGTNYKKVASDMNIAADTAAWYWKKNNLNKHADKDDIRATCKVINPALLEYTKGRRVAWIKLKEAFGGYPYNCLTDASKHEAPVYEEGVLEEMRKWADQHVQYTMETSTPLRTKFDESALGKLDCSEFVCRYLHKLGITDTVKHIATDGMITQEKFRTSVGNNNIDFLTGSDSEDYTPQAGDIFVWSRAPGDGHTGVVHSVDGDKITILEAIGKNGSSDEPYHINEGGYEGMHCSRTSYYRKDKKALAKHGGWKGYFRPKNYTKQL